MFIFLVALMAFFAYRNTVIARRKGQNTIVWVFITVVSVFLFMILGEAFILMTSYKGPLTPVAFAKFFYDNPLKELTVYAVGAGGGLLIGYILERMPDKK